MRVHPASPIRPDDIRLIRQALGLSRRDFADLLWLSHGSGEQTVRRWETGETTPIGPAVQAILALYDGWRPPNRIGLVKALREKREAASRGESKTAGPRG